MEDIKGYEGLYAITSCGKVWSYRKQLFLKPGIDKDGYLQVLLYRNGKPKMRKMHRLVAEIYVPNLDNKPVVNHKDENKQNNCVNNLQWMTIEENNHYSNTFNKAAEARKKPIYCEELNKVFESAADAARELNLYRTNICAVCNGRQKTTGGYHFRYAEVG